ncbi:YHYH protein [Cellulophaga baltica]|uniref:YHYH protein n=1 Tax=Cellulophaga TaxID=104264 RepID=UPI001C067968|nr:MULTISPECIES: YHYH protein [Cellulophaga]MBU2995226.1 YHYH protein [Cellulophaga baltica]MDO6766621.1 YHYH protein [Cellulophaga sp. 1_MG-2023]
MNTSLTIIKRIKIFSLVITFTTINYSCSSDSENTDETSTEDDVTTSTSIDVNSDYFTSSLSISTIPCTLSDGTETDCYQIVTTSTPEDHDMGPWCPDNIEDDAEAGGIWLDDGNVYDVDGAFVENLSTFYNDDTWLMYDDNGDVYITETEEDCIAAANPDVGEEYKNYCVECLPSYISDLEQTWIIPITPEYQTSTYNFLATGGPGVEAGPSTRGIALNGIEYSAPAPVSDILGAYTLAPFDDAGGHINVHQGYHYHAATGYSTTITQTDDHAALIGYAMDGYAIYELTDADGNEPSDLDDCRGHSDDVRGYHYHIDSAGNNNFIDCLHGAYVASY